MGDKGGGSSTPTFVQAPQQDNSAAELEGIFGMMNALMEQNAIMSQNMMLQQQYSTPPESSYSGIDWEAENKALQEKIDKQVTEEDLKRKGVLGTILTSMDDEDEPDTVGSLLEGEVT